MVSVVFMGGPHDGLEMEIPDAYAEFRLAQLAEPVPEMVSVSDPMGVLDAVKPNYTAYRKTGRVLRGRRVYSLVLRR
jgi:hypothetical protein